MCLNFGRGIRLTPLARAAVTPCKATLNFPGLLMGAMKPWTASFVPQSRNVDSGGHADPYCSLHVGKWRMENSGGASRITPESSITRRSRDTHCPDCSARRHQAPSQSVHECSSVLLGHRKVESPAIGPHRQTYALTFSACPCITRRSRNTHCSCCPAEVQQGAVRRQHTLSRSKVRLRPPSTPVLLGQGGEGVPHNWTGQSPKANQYPRQANMLQVHSEAQPQGCAGSWHNPKVQTVRAPRLRPPLSVAAPLLCTERSGRLPPAKAFLRSKLVLSRLCCCMLR